MREKKYKSMVFDFDGVILNSNELKTDAYKYAVEFYTADQIQEFISFHKKNGGMSRYEKFKYFMSKIAPENIPNLSLDDLLLRFSSFIDEKIDSCEIADGLDLIRYKYQNIRWLIVSGSDQVELRAYAKKMKIDKYFDAGIYGSPEDKKGIIANAINGGVIELPAVLFGDSQLDYEVAKEFNLDFIFVSDWTDMSDWPNYCMKNNLSVIGRLLDINLS